MEQTIQPRGENPDPAGVDFVGKMCPHCRTVIKATAEAVICPECRSAHHRQCWEQNGGCAVPGCTAQPSRERGAADYSYEPLAKRPPYGGVFAWGLILAILASLRIIGSLWAFVMPSTMPEAIEEHLGAQGRSITFYYVVNVFELISATVLLVCAVGVLRLRDEMRRFLVIWAYVVIAFAVGMAILNLAGIAQHPGPLQMVLGLAAFLAAATAVGVYGTAAWYFTTESAKRQFWVGTGDPPKVDTV